jgi:predicted O-methyltransferase YrrM
MSADRSDRELWAAVDGYIVEKVVGGDAALDEALVASEEAGLPAINVTAAQGKFLALLAEIKGVRTILEVGTLGGYSSIWLARALPEGGRLVSLELSPVHAEVARKNIARAGLAEVVEVRVGPALESLAHLVDSGTEPFDMVFIDADKQNNAEYFALAMRLVRRGSVIVIDNVVRAGRVLDAIAGDPDVVGTRRMFDVLSGDSRVSASALQTVGSKGYDGFLLALVTADL